MSENAFEEFKELVLRDDSLQKELRDLTDRNELIRCVIRLAHERGYKFTSAELEEEMRMSRRITTER